MPKRADDENEDALKSDVAISTLFDVRGKVVVISGGGSGLGAMMATAFVRNGATVYIFSRKDTSQFAAELTAAGPGTCMAVVADAQRPATVEALVHRCVAVANTVAAPVSCLCAKSPQKHCTRLYVYCILLPRAASFPLASRSRTSSLYCEQ